MTEAKDEVLSPTVTKILDAYLEALMGDSDIDNEAARRLDDLLRKGGVPKPKDIDDALFPADDDKVAT